MLWKIALIVSGYYYFGAKDKQLAYRWLAAAAVLLVVNRASAWTSLGATIMSNKVTFNSQLVNKVYSSYITLHDPSSFRDAVLVYDPAEADFDAWVVRATFGGRGGTRMSGFQRAKGSPFPEDPSKLMVQLFRPVMGVDGYNKPRQPKESTYVHRLDAEFMYVQGDRAGAGHEAALAKLDGLRRTARVMLKDERGRFVEVGRFGPQWGYRPVLHSS